MTSTNEDDLLKILQAHGQQFLDSFSGETSDSKKRKINLSPLPPRKKIQHTPSSTDNEDDEEEWLGIAGGSDYARQLGSEDDGDFEQDDDNFTGESSNNRTNVTIFADFSSKRILPSVASKAQMKAFMSSKVSKVRQEIPNAPEQKKTSADIEDERSNAQNDALLHRLVHTKILSGSLNPELELTPAHRRKALAGRVLELSGGAKLGKGEKSVREKERNKAAKRVREGIVEKQKEKGKQELEEAKNIGNYHPTIKKLFESSSAAPAKKRERGLKMGVGKFSGGLLKLSREEIDIAEGRRPGRGGGHRGSDRGWGRGRGTGIRGRSS